MELKDLFYGIQDFFVNVAFAPLDFLRSLELESWVAASSLNWLFLIIGFCAFFYWMRELDRYNKEAKNDDSVLL